VALLCYATLRYATLRYATLCHARSDPRIGRLLETPGEEEPDYEKEVWSPAVELTNSVEASHDDDFYTYDTESRRMNISSKYRAKLTAGCIAQHSMA
jgi:hypothetical protein